MNDRAHILLLSSSTVHGRGYLDHAEQEIRAFLGVTKRVLFVPFAAKDHRAYTARTRARFAEMGYAVDSIHETPEMMRAIESAEAIFIGGGNTFRLLKCLYDFNLLTAIRQRVAHGMPYLGASAGSNVAGPTIRTTNDMPIVEPPSFEALGLVPFQINPHYLDADPNSTHMGETREERLVQYLEENATPVVALREGAMLLMSNGHLEIRGSASARLFRREQPPLELQVGDTIEA